MLCNRLGRLRMPMRPQMHVRGRPAVARVAPALEYHPSDLPNAIAASFGAYAGNPRSPAPGHIHNLNLDENDLPLVVKYSVASLGEIKLCLAPLPSQ